MINDMSVSSSDSYYDVLKIMFAPCPVPNHRPKVQLKRLTYTVP